MSYLDEHDRDDWMLEREDNGPSDTTERENGWADDTYAHIEDDECIPPEIQEQLEARLQELCAIDAEQLDSQALDAVGAEIYHIQQLLGITDEWPGDEDEIPF